jgi:hypothetical protein
MKPPRAITIVLFVSLTAACGNHNNVRVGSHDSSATANTSNTDANNSGSTTPDQPLNQQCDPNYSGCVPVATDVDCAGKGGNGPAYVQGPIKVIGKDIYGLDRDRNGIACE